MPMAGPFNAAVRDRLRGKLSPSLDIRWDQGDYWKPHQSHCPLIRCFLCCIISSTSCNILCYSQYSWLWPPLCSKSSSATDAKDLSMSKNPSNPSSISSSISLTTSPSALFSETYPVPLYSQNIFLFSCWCLIKSGESSWFLEVHLYPQTIPPIFPDLAYTWKRRP